MKNKKTIAAVIALVLLVAAAVGCWLAFAPEQTVGEKHITVEVTHKDGSVNTYDIVTEEGYLYDALKAENLVGEITDGYFVTLDGEASDTTSEVWWGYTKSGEYVNYGVGQCVIEDGDHYEFTFHVGW